MLQHGYNLFWCKSNDFFFSKKKTDKIFHFHICAKFQKEKRKKKKSS